MVPLMVPGTKRRVPAVWRGTGARPQKGLIHEVILGVEEKL